MQEQDKFAPRRMAVRNTLEPKSVTEAIHTRRSIRQFTDEVVPPATIAELLELSSRSPSGGNVQPWKVYVLGPNKRDELVAKVAERIATKRFEAEGCKC
jgi:nitroreductase